MGEGTGAGALRWLILSFSLLSFFIIHKTIITGCGHPRLAGLLTVIMLPVCVRGCCAPVPERDGAIGRSNDCT